MAKKSGDKTDTLWPWDLRQAMSWNTDMMNATAKANTTLLRGAAQWNHELRDLMSRRLSENFSHPLKLGECRDPKHFSNLQTQYFQSMAGDYTNALYKMYGIWGETFQDLAPDALKTCCMPPKSNKKE